MLSKLGLPSFWESRNVIDATMNLMIVRHAESTANSENRMQGRIDYPLSEAGRWQSRRLRARLEREAYKPTHIYSSPLIRASETARIASSTWDIPIELWNDLVETNIGVISGLTWAEAEERIPEATREINATGNFDFVRGAETHIELTDRAQRVVDRLIREHVNTDSVLMFSHGGIMSYVICSLLGADRIWSLGIHNTAVFEFSIDKDRWYLDGPPLANKDLWRIERFNDAGHLGQNSGQ